MPIVDAGWTLRHPPSPHFEIDATDKFVINMFRLDILLHTIITYYYYYFRPRTKTKKAEINVNNKKRKRVKTLIDFIIVSFMCLFFFFFVVVLLLVCHRRQLGVMGATSRHPSVDSWPIHIHIGSALRGDAFTAHRRMDVTYPIRTTKGLRRLWGKCVHF